MPLDRCVFCDALAEGNFSVHRDGFSVGPEVPLCDACGSGSTPTLSDIWTKIAQRSADPFAFYLVDACR